MEEPAEDLFSFHLAESFLEPYKTRRVPWGFTDAAGNSLGEITFLRTYSRLKVDSRKERWWECCKRVIQGMYSIQKDHCLANRLPWDEQKAQLAAQDAFERMFTFKWTPPGRGLWMMGTPLVMRDRNSAALQNCAFISTADMTYEDPTGPFAFLMEASMLGIGVGFDTKGAAKNFRIYSPHDTITYVVPDTREGWVELMTRTLEAYLKPNCPRPIPDVRNVRDAGQPIKTFGGTAAGPGPLLKLYHHLVDLLEGRAGEFGPVYLTTQDILDICNMIGICVVAGNVRRSAELAMGSIHDKDFLLAKDFSQYDEDGNVTYQGSRDYRSEWGWMSNNSVEVNVGDDLSSIVDGIALNGEPGVIWMDLARAYGRLGDPKNDKDWRLGGFNPCVEQGLESGECCTLVETYISNHETLEDYTKTLKVAYLYAKTVTLLPTHWPKTNAIMQRNRRIGTGMSGISDFADNRGWTDLREWMDTGYNAVQHYDEIYSEWLCVRESIKTTTVKPSGSVSLLAGVSPGVHWGPGGEYFDRGVTFSGIDPLAYLCEQAGYKLENSVVTPGSVFVQFPIHSKAKRNDKQVSLFEKAHLASEAQRLWSDNSVSVTLSFNAQTESQDVGLVLRTFEGKLKTASFLPQGNKTYLQMPYQQITQEEYEDAELRLMRIDLEPIYQGLGLEAIGEAYCTTDSCEVPTLKIEAGA